MDFDYIIIGGRRGQRLYPHDGTDTALKADIRARADTIYHPVGTCKMGVDDRAAPDWRQYKCAHRDDGRKAGG